MKTSILQFLKTIPLHRVTTYKIISQHVNLHPRAVARILASKTEQDIYPCYKVICSDGSLGGYNLGIDEKIRRLESDNVQIINQKVMSRYIRSPLDKTI